MPGRFSWLVTPYLREILDACAERGVERVVCRKSSQIGWTDSITCNLVGWRIDTNPGRTLILFPREKTAIDFNDEKLEPMIEASASLAAKVQLKSRAAGNRQLFKKYSGGFLKLIASNAPGDVKSTSAPLVIVEEPDDCNQNVRGQGDSIKLAEDRMKSYHGALLVIGGTPTISGVSAIDNEMKKTDRRFFHVPCHHCDEALPLAWENVRWEKDSANPDPVHGKHHPETARYACPSLRRSMERRRALSQRAARPMDRDGAVQRRAWLRWPERALQPVPALDDGERRRKVPRGAPRVFRRPRREDDRVSQRFAGPIVRIRIRSAGECRARGARRGLRRANRASGGLVLVAGVDVQHNRLALAIWAYGRDGETWLVFWGEEYGAPPNPRDAVWAALDTHVDRAYAHESGGACYVDAVSIDSSDGQTSDAVYEWVRKRDRTRCKVMAVKGRSTPGGEIYSTPPAKSTIDPTVRDKASRYGVKPFMVGTEKAKDLLLGFTAEGGRIKRCDRAADGTVATGRGAGRMHWYRGVRPDFFEQLADSEVKIPSARAGGRLVWTLKTGKRNEALNCTVYAEHAARAIRLHVYTDSQWVAHENALRPLPKMDGEAPAGPRLGKDPIPTAGGFLPTAASLTRWRQ